MDSIIIVGGGLAGTEAALHLAHKGFNVLLYEMRPKSTTPAHVTDNLAELVCSNSLKSMYLDKAQGLLKEELKQTGSFLLGIAWDTRVPAGKSLSVDRELFARSVTELIEKQAGIELIRDEVDSIPDADGVIIASGPLTSPALTKSIQDFLGEDDMYFFDAVSPIVDITRLDWSRAFWASRYEEGKDYVNCVLDRNEFDAFARELAGAQRIPVREFEPDKLFEGCLPVEQMARRSPEAIRFGPMKPVGLTDPATGKRPWAVVQLRREKAEGPYFNLVGFQTRLTFQEQKRVFGMIPALGAVTFERFGSMHRNTYINGPGHLLPTFETRKRKGLFFGGQITGVEGYVESIASGLIAAMNLAQRARGKEPNIIFPETTIVGGLQRHISSSPKSGRFQPSAANFGLVPPLEPSNAKKKDRTLYAERSLRDLKNFLEQECSKNY